MSYIEPNSVVKIYTTNVNGESVPFDVNMENTVLFVSGEQQQKYLETFRPILLTKNSYTRVNRGVIKIGFDKDITSEVYKDKIIAAVYNSNYMAFKNTSFENKWFYAFIDSAEYLNNNTVTIAYHIDVIQTYMFDWVFNQCLIEREHTVTDAYGEHTLPEQLETGPYRSIPATVKLMPYIGRAPITHEAQYDSDPEHMINMYNKYEYERCIILATTLDVNKMEEASAFNRPEYAPGVVVPGNKGVGHGGEYYSGLRYTPFLISGSVKTGIYRITIGGVYSDGDKIVVDDTMLTIENNETTWVQIATNLANLINYNSLHYTATHDVNTNWFTLTEKTDWEGYGSPNVQTNSERGSIYAETITPGSAGGLSEIYRLNTFLVNVASSELENAVVGLFMAPYEFVPQNNDDVNYGVPEQRLVVEFPTSLGDPLSGYVPRNKKLFCSPFNEMYVTNNTGNEAIYRFEDFANPVFRTSCVFTVWGNISMNPGMYCAPMFYNGNGYMSGAIDDELVVTGFPMCSYAIDSFRAWLAQNAGMIGATAGSIAASWATFIGGAIGMAKMAGAATSAFRAGGILNDSAPGLMTQNSLVPVNYNSNVNFSQQMFTPQTPSGGLIGATLGALGTLYDHSRKPPQSHGTSNGNLAYQAGQLTFSWYYKQIKPEYAEIIDKFFDMYGYKTNRVGTPILNARPRYSYVKTVGCSLDGLIPGDMKRVIEGIFDKGIRFWQPNATFGNFDPEVNPNTPIEGSEGNG